MPSPRGERPKGLKREVVVSRFREHLNWLSSCPWHISVYDTGWTPYSLEAAHSYRALPNKGREAGMMMRHIIDHYDDLAEWTVFVQGDGRSHAPDLVERIRWEGWTEPTPLSTWYRKEFPMMPSRRWIR
jgi:hypothetical protein